MVDLMIEDSEINRGYLIEELRNHSLSWLANRTAIDIDMYLNGKELSSNSFSKLARILQRTIESKKTLQGRREIDQFEIMRYYQKSLESHSEKHPESQYRLKTGITQVSELAQELTPIIFQITQDLSDLSKIPKEKLEELKSLSITFSHIASSYHESLKRFAAA